MGPDLGRTATAFHRALKGLNRYVKPIPLFNQQRDDAVGCHSPDRSTWVGLAQARPAETSPRHSRKDRSKGALERHYPQPNHPFNELALVALPSNRLSTRPRRRAAPARQYHAG